MNNKQTLIAVGAALLATNGTGFAAESQEDPWLFDITVPAWAAGINGNATIKGRKEDVNISFSDLKSHLQCSFALAAEARKGKFGFFSDISYMKFTGGGTVADAVNISGDLKFVMANAGVSYQLVKTGEEHPFVLEATLGVRYWYTETGISLTDVRDPAHPFQFSGGNCRYLVDPMIGLQGSQYLTKKLHLDFAGDVGGFNVSDNSARVDWSATAELTYDFAKWFSLSAGYQAVGVDWSRGSGTSKNGINLIFNGALIEAHFKF